MRYTRRLLCNFTLLTILPGAVWAAGAGCSVPNFATPVGMAAMGVGCLTIDSGFGNLQLGASSVGPYVSAPAFVAEAAFTPSVALAQNVMGGIQTQQYTPSVAANALVSSALSLSASNNVSALGVGPAGSAPITFAPTSYAQTNFGQTSLGPTSLGPTSFDQSFAQANLGPTNFQSSVSVGFSPFSSSCPFCLNGGQQTTFVNQTFGGTYTPVGFTTSGLNLFTSFNVDFSSFNINNFDAFSAGYTNPEPSTFILMGTALLLLSFLTRSRRSPN